MKFTTKLYATLGSILLLMSVSVVLLLNLLEQSMIQMHVVVNELYERTEIASDIKFETANMGREFREIINGPKNESVTNSVNTWEASNLRIRQEIEALKEKDTEEKTLELIDKYIALHDSYQNKVHRVINMKKLDIEAEIPSVLVEDIRLNRERMHSSF